jgi:DNA-binding NarL/FixJ family response regulator
MQDLDGLPTESLLDQLAKTLVQLRSGAANSPLVPLTSLARHLPRGASLTVDLTRAQQLSAPLIVLRVPDARVPAADDSALTPRQREVARWLALGCSNKTIARRLRLTVGTVKDHVHSILAKTGCKSRAEFAAMRRRPASDSRA